MDLSFFSADYYFHSACELFSPPQHGGRKPKKGRRKTTVYDEDESEDEDYGSLAL